MDERLREAFDEVRADEALKERTRAFLADKTAKRRRRPVWRLAAACLTLLVLAGGALLWTTPVAAVSVDVNPSLELALNCFDRVVEVEGRNADGEALASTLQVKYLRYTDALEQILTNAQMESYLDQAQVSITVAGADESKSQALLAGAQACTEGLGNISCHCGSMEEVTAAREVGLSLGKYQALLELQALDPAITAQDVQDLTMRQIRDWIDQLSGQQGSSTPGNAGGAGQSTGGDFCGSSSGHGHQHGHGG